MKSGCIYHSAVVIMDMIYSWLNMRKLKLKDPTLVKN